MMAKARDFLSTWSVCQTPTCRLSTCDKDLIGLAGASVITEAARKKLGGVQPICKQTFAPGRFIRTVSPRLSHLHTSNLPPRTIHSTEEDSPLTHSHTFAFPLHFEIPPAMEIDGGAMAFAPQQKNAATILCADCGAPVDGTISGAFCYDCIKLKTDVTSGVQREAILL